jgi:predicted AlkP superfamily pyrophosphatase or phosphodiesterase
MLVFRFLADEFGYRPPKVPSRFSQQENTDLLTVFLIDGLRADVFEEELEAGNLPSLSKLAGSGCRVNSVMTVFPSITGYAYWPLQTGIDATRSGHLGTRYFDRRVDVGNWRNHYGPAGVQFEPNFEPQVNTLFEASSDGWTLAGNSMLHRGANVTYTPSLEQYFTKIQHKWWLPKLLRKLPVLRWLAPDFYEYEQRFMRRILNLLQQGQPRVAWIVFGSPDNVAHALGVHDEYRRVLRAIDEAIGQYIKAVRSPSSKYTSLTFAVISDHVSIFIQAQHESCNTKTPALITFPFSNHRAKSVSTWMRAAT